MPTPDPTQLSRSCLRWVQLPALPSETAWRLRRTLVPEHTLPVWEALGLYRSPRGRDTSLLETGFEISMGTWR